MQMALSFAQQHPALDGDRLGLWGASYSGANVLTVAATDRRVKAVVSIVPFIAGHAQFVLGSGEAAIAIKGHNVMKGHYNQPEATAEVIRDGWFRSGDLARRDEDGWYYIVDQAKDLIIRGGFNIYPREVEELLMQHPAVSLVAVIGVPHESHGEEVKAVVVKEPDAACTEEELMAWAKERLAAYK